MTPTRSPTLASGGTDRARDSLSLSAITRVGAPHIPQADKLVTLDTLNARLRAQRVALAWLIARTDAEGAGIFLRARAKGELPPQDQQEDPGAVLTDAFAALAAFGDELESILALVPDIDAQSR